MAALLDEFASKLVGILAGMVKEEVEMLLGVPGEVTKLETTLRDLSHILGDAERKRIRDKATEGWVRELKDVMYDADDVLDLCQLMDGGEEDPPAPTSAPKTTSRFWDIPKMFFCFRNPVVAHEIGTKIQAINQRLEDLAKRSSRFISITQAIHASADSINKASNSLSDETGSVFIRSDVVGEKIEDDTKKIVDLLIKKVDAPAGSRANNDVVVAAAITGIGGIGKTTLAKMVFADSRVGENFEERIWLSVNREFDEINVLQSLIASFGAKHEGCAGNKDLLQRALNDTIRQKKKFLLVMDDVWNENVWYALLREPLSHGANASGSRVLVTTRNDGIAHGMKAQHLHRVDKLTTEDAWILLKNQVVLNETDEADVDELKSIGMEIVKRCDCLPLAVKILGGLLRRKSRTRHDWMDVSSHDTWSTTGIDEDINKAVYLSYEDLPSHLKQCFVYCSLIPKDKLIIREAIVQHWIAAGHVHNKMSYKAPEKLGEEYYNELVSRNLLEPDKSYYGIQACSMHDVVRSFAQYIIKDEGILISDGLDANRTLSTAKLRHLSISNKAVGHGTLQKQALLRTLMLFGSSTTVELKNLLNNTSCLRVLHLVDVDPVELPDSICHLKHLRHLCIDNASISTIPRDIGNLKFLQALELAKCTNVSQLPTSILKLRKLRSLDLSDTAITSIPRGLGKLEDLVRIRGFPTHYSDEGTGGWCSLEELRPLSKLQSLEISCLEKASSGSMAAKANLSSKHHLTNLNLIFTSRLGDNGEVEGNISEEEHRRTEDILDNLCPPPCMELLDIIGYFARGLPQWMRTMSAFGSLRRLALDDYACCAQLPNGLGQLPFLDYFVVDRAPSVQCVGHDFLFPSLGGQADGKVTRNNKRQPHHTSRGAGVAFPKLTEVGFVGMLGWTEWEWEQHVPAMPALEELTIRNCKLQRLPAGLAQHACRLRELDLRNIQLLVSVENFPSVVKLWSYDNPRLERISNNPSLQWIDIRNCRALEELDGLPSLRSLVWQDEDAQSLPEYLREAKPKKLYVDCNRRLVKLFF
ncbi:disease resistance RPP13-like protein 4 isoform X1 [Setaria italica]|uniref:disease resistance RPP13-like protein 4 isoform X1 n=1 Tax=Setaria italica TaxID=4555 RepID=UPI000BE5A231|nr:disease resistance RPP13-like protein 4 isoform X1 [Setaria italica]